MPPEIGIGDRHGERKRKRGEKQYKGDADCNPPETGIGVLFSHGHRQEGQSDLFEEPGALSVFYVLSRWLWKSEAVFMAFPYDFQITDNHFGVSVSISEQRTIVVDCQQQIIQLQRRTVKSVFEEFLLSFRQKAFRL